LLSLVQAIQPEILTHMLEPRVEELVQFLDRLQVIC
jgi:hypothetical protein